ncbi:hypothetical protein SAICODRAFT_70848 [Saitoella complicata NRRL Y-17804]|uniref:uncharacterized protein n=1 Tax=Saitoella complicata (strain BCRC 22490 / CBS 7301 / JCM 7358 / NBRC 10748 / NRRL Y-17804) TaxID=698492 RepID=UPI000867045D|nr:uncharacterized protein SAICODRAFT_70848 [Saitoella complicata NRRL Y-17804]ODQ53719.1 hypothetical protein SAICODRAFT_70848 [Saitoella complicata NRRL Y-17804]
MLSATFTPLKQPSKSVSLENSVLVLPAISIANVPQLAVDLLIHTLALPLIGRLDDRYLTPFVGAREDPKGEQGVCTALEVYGNGKITVIQQRAPTLPHARKLFIEQVLLRFIKENGFSRVVCVTSMDATMRTDADIRGPRFVHYPTISSLSLSEEPALPSLPSSGITKSLVKMSRDQGIKVEVVGMWVMEGDNTGDAEELAGAILDAHEKGDASAPEAPQGGRTWVRPGSWKGLFGEELVVGHEGGMFW